MKKVFEESRIGTIELKNRILRSATHEGMGDNCNVIMVEPHEQSPGYLTNAQVERHPGQKLAHSSTARGLSFLLPG